MTNDIRGRGANAVQPRLPRRADQEGAVLLVALVFLILLTLLAIGASSSSLLQQRMVSATRSAQLATMSADTALRGAEWQLWSSTAIVTPPQCDRGDINPVTGCIVYDPTAAPYAPGGAVTEFRTGNGAWLALTGPVTYTGADTSGYTSVAGTWGPTADIAKNPQYIIEDMGPATAGGPLGEGGVTGPQNSAPGQPRLDIYRITARATGGSTGTVRVVQSIFDAAAN